MYMVITHKQLQHLDSNSFLSVSAQYAECYKLWNVLNVCPIKVLITCRSRKQNRYRQKVTKCTVLATVIWPLWVFYDADILFIIINQQIYFKTIIKDLTRTEKFYVSLFFIIKLWNDPGHHILSPWCIHLLALHKIEIFWI